MPPSSASVVAFPHTSSADARALAKGHAKGDETAAGSSILNSTVADVHHDIELESGTALGPYDLLAPIGEGGMARVWAARVRGKKDVVALKMLLPELAENDEFRKMFFDEARIASRVRHPNVCSTFEMGEQQGVLYLAMEWLDGPSLMRVLRPGREDVTECERIPLRPRVAARPDVGGAKEVERPRRGQAQGPEGVAAEARRVGDPH